MLPPFHLAIPVDDLAAARAFYGGLLGCAEGRSADTWIDFNFYGHQFVTHLGTVIGNTVDKNAVDHDAVPSFHFGVILPPEAWQALADKLLSAKVDFIIPPKTRFKGKVGEQSTMFFKDPAGNAIEIKSFADMDQIFAK